MYLAIAELADEQPSGNVFSQLLQAGEKALPGVVQKIVGGPATTTAPAPAPKPAVLPVEPGGTPGWVVPVAIGAGVLVAGGIAAWLLLKKK